MATLPNKKDWDWWPDFETWLLTDHNADGSHSAGVLAVYDNRDYANLAAAIAAIGATEAELHIFDAETLTASATFPSTLSVVMHKGGSIAKASTYTCTFNGPFEAGIYQTFSGFGSGDVSFADDSCDFVRPEWWGALGDDSTDCTNAIDYALATGLAVHFVKGTYQTTGGHQVDDQMFLGRGRYDTTLKRASGTTTIVTLLGNGVVANMTLDGNTLNGHGLIVSTDVSTPWYPSQVKNIRFQNCIPASLTTANITDVSNAADAVITSAGHGLSVGELVRIRSVVGVVSTVAPSDSPVNHVFRVLTTPTVDTFTIAEDTSAYTAYTSGGTWERAPYALCIEQLSGEYAALVKTLEDLEFRNNYGHIYMGYCRYTTIDRFQMFGDTDDYAIYLSNLDCKKNTFRHGYMESGIRTSHNGIRDISFENIRCGLTAANAWGEPFYYSMGYNAGSGADGGEITGISFVNLTVNRSHDDASSAFFETNNYNFLWKNIHIIDTVTTGVNVVHDAGTYYSSYHNVIIEISNAWNFFEDGCRGTTLSDMYQCHFSQGINGTVILSARKLSGETTGMISVRHSSLDYEIEGPSGTARAYHFSHVSGDINLTNATAGGCTLINCTGSITEPADEISFRVHYEGGVEIDYFKDGLIVGGKDGDTRGALTLWDGSGGNTPGYAKIHSPNGTPWYFFVEDDGTFKVHNAVPTQNSDGSVVGAQT